MAPTSTQPGNRASTARGARAAAPAATADNLATIAARLRATLFVSERAVPPEQETIDAIQDRLAVPAAGLSEEEIAHNISPEDGHATDPSFLPGPSALFPDEASNDMFVWQRVSGALYQPSSADLRIIKGYLNDGWFLGALAAVAVRRDLLLDLLVSDDLAASGLYTFQFYKHGAWHRVAVDNFLPCFRAERRLAFACSGNIGELWVSLLEKAYAKVHGSYHALQGGSVCDALVDLTGGVAFKVKFGPDEEGGPYCTRPSEGPEPVQRLFAQLRDWLRAGHIVTAMAKDKDAAAAADAAAAGEGYDDEGEGSAFGAAAGAGGVRGADGLCGLELNQLYTVIDARYADEATPLVRLHCAFPHGVWTGPWSASAPEWSRLENREFRESVADTLDGPAGTFWMPFSDFADIFNRSYVCRSFPPSWHQLTLHCGWMGPSAGGPYHLNGHFNGTWAYNPQFRVIVRKPCTMLICLGQQDPTMRCGGHVRKAARSARVGMTVLQVSADALGRRWEVKPHEVAAETGLTAAREVVVELKAEPGHAYVVVPYASAPGEEAAFVLRAFCSAPVEVEQLPSPLSLIIGGQWVGQLAGGDRHQPTWGSNPQYMLSTQHRAQALISVSRSDIAYSIIKPRPKADEYVGYVLVKPEVQPDGLGRRAAVREDAGELLAEVGYSHNEEALQLVTLEAETPYVLVPSLASAGVEAPFEVRILSATPVELIPLPEVKAVVLDGSWDEATSGGCDLNPAWRKNPRFLLQLEGQPGASYPVKTSIRVTLARKAAAVHKGGGAATRSGHPRARGVPVDEMIGFYVIRADDSTMSPAGDLKRAMLAETAFVPEVQLSETLTLMAPGSYLLVPCTYAPGKLGGFTLGVTCRENFMLTRLA